MLRLTKLLVPIVAASVGFAVFAPPAAANTVVKSVYRVDESDVDRGVCSFGVRFDLHGYFKNVDYYDNSGFLYKSIDTVGGGGPFRVTATAHGTTLTMQNEAFSAVITYRRNGSVKTYTQRGLFDKFTTPGGGIVLLDTGIAVFLEPSEEVVFAGGPHQAVNGDFDAFCAAFG
jgi:hypothetical protein